MVFKLRFSSPTPDIILTATLVIATFLFSFCSFHELKESVKAGNLVIFSALCIAILGACCLRLVAKNVTPYLVLRRMDFLVLLLFLFILLNRFGQQPQAGLSLNSIEFAYLIIFYLACSLLPAKYTKALLMGIMLSGLIEVLIGYSQFFAFTASNHKLFKVTGSFNNPGPFSGYIAISLALAIAGVFNRNAREMHPSKRWDKLLLVLNLMVIVLGLPILLLSHSRAAILAVFVVLMINLIGYIPVLIRSDSANFKRLKSVAFVLIPLISIALTMGLYYLNVDSGNGRLLVWKICKNIFLDHPFVGVGYDNIKMYYMSYQGKYFALEGSESEQRIAGNVSYVFNEYIQFITENGIIGSIYLCVVILALLYTLKRAVDKKFALVCFSGIAAVCIFSLFSYASDILPIKVVLVTLISTIAKMDRKQMIFSNPLRKLNAVFLPSVFILSLTLLYFMFVKAKELYYSYRDWKTAEHYYVEKDYEQAASSFSKLYQNFGSDGAFLMEYGKALSLSLKDDEAISILARAKIFANSPNVQIALGNLYQNKKMYSAADECYISASDMVPVMFYPRYLRAKLYFSTGQYLKAAEVAAQILKKKQKVFSPAVRQIKREMKEILQESQKRY